MSGRDGLGLQASQPEVANVLDVQALAAAIEATTGETACGTGILGRVA
jgi:hypothetical protein